MWFSLMQLFYSGWRSPHKGPIPSHPWGFDLTVSVLQCLVALCLSLFLTNFQCLLCHPGLWSLLGVRHKAPGCHGFSSQLCHSLSCVILGHFIPNPVSSELPHLSCHHTKYILSLPMPLSMVVLHPCASLGAAAAATVGHHSLFGIRICRSKPWDVPQAAGCAKSDSQVGILVPGSADPLFSSLSLSVSPVWL